MKFARALWFLAFWIATPSLFIPHQSGADTFPRSTNRLSTSCTVVELCRAMTSVGSCIGSNGDEAVFQATKRVSARCYAPESTGTFTVNLKGSVFGHDASPANGGSDMGSDISTADGSLQMSSVISAAPVPFLWGEVKTCTTCSVNLSCMICDEN